MSQPENVSRGTFHAAPAPAQQHVQAIYRPRRGDVLIFNRAEETLAIAEADVPDLIAALADAFGIPAHARALMLERGETAFSAR